MKRIIITENQLKTLIEYTKEEVIPVKPTELKLTKIIETHGNKNK